MTEHKLDAMAQAKEELAEEDYIRKVEAYKIQLRKTKWWHRVFPWVILIRRRGND